MGNPRPKPKRLAEKLRAIREGLELSQTQMLKRLKHEKTSTTAAFRSTKAESVNRH
jgi:hypothetical protein